MFKSNLFIQVETIRNSIGEKSALLEAEQFKFKRKEEDALGYKRKLDRHKKDNPLSTTIDEVFMFIGAVYDLIIGRGIHVPIFTVSFPNPHHM